MSFCMQPVSPSTDFVEIQHSRLRLQAGILQIFSNFIDPKQKTSSDMNINRNFHVSDEPFQQILLKFDMGHFHRMMLSISSFKSYWSITKPSLHNQLHDTEPLLRSRQLCSFSSNFHHLIEPEGSLPCLHGPSTGAYSETDRYSISLRSILIFSTHLCLGLPNGLFPSCFCHQYATCIPLRPHSCYKYCPSHAPWLDHSNYTWRRVWMYFIICLSQNIMKLERGISS
jgi:hypothetical protein